MKTNFAPYWSLDVAPALATPELLTSEFFVVDTLDVLACAFVVTTLYVAAAIPLYPVPNTKSTTAVVTISRTV